MRSERWLDIYLHGRRKNIHKMATRGDVEYFLGIELGVYKYALVSASRCGSLRSYTSLYGVLDMRYEVEHVRLVIGFSLGALIPG